MLERREGEGGNVDEAIHSGTLAVALINEMKTRANIFILAGNGSVSPRSSTNCTPQSSLEGGLLVFQIALRAAPGLNKVPALLRHLYQWLLSAREARPNPLTSRSWN